jgi:hypothetical protein
MFTNVNNSATGAIFHYVHMESSVMDCYHIDNAPLLQLPFPFSVFGPRSSVLCHHILCKRLGPESFCEYWPLRSWGRCPVPAGFSGLTAHRSTLHELHLPQMPPAPRMVRAANFYLTCRGKNKRIATKDQNSSALYKFETHDQPLPAVGLSFSAGLIVRHVHGQVNILFVRFPQNGVMELKMHMNMCILPCLWCSRSSLLIVRFREIQFQLAVEFRECSLHGSVKLIPRRGCSHESSSPQTSVKSNRVIRFAGAIIPQKA